MENTLKVLGKSLRYIWISASDLHFRILQGKVQIIFADRWSKTTSKVVLLFVISGIMSPMKVNKERKKENKKTKKTENRQRQMFDRKLGKMRLAHKKLLILITKGGTFYIKLMFAV
jgi:hypothetical protein